jgi:CxxC motif-containing protein
MQWCSLNRSYSQVLMATMRPAKDRAEVMGVISAINVNYNLRFGVQNLVTRLTVAYPVSIGDSVAGA